MSDFYKDLQRGRKGEGLVAAALEARGHKVENVSMIASYQYDDIDLLLTSPKGDYTTLEVKNDFVSNRTGNVFIEETNYNNIRRAYKGWLYYS